MKVVPISSIFFLPLDKNFIISYQCLPTELYYLTAGIKSASKLGRINFFLFQVFQRCGELQKMVTFIRNDQFHALIQYSNPKEASAAKTLFDRQNIYNGCNTLHVEFSKMTELTVKYNNEKMR